MKLSIPGRIFAGFLAMMLTFAAVSGYTALQVRRLGQRMTRLHQTLVPLSPALAEIQADVDALARISAEQDPTLLKRTVGMVRRSTAFEDRITSRFAQVQDLLQEQTPEGAGPLLTDLEALDSQRVALMGRLTTFFETVEQEAPYQSQQRVLIKALSDYRLSLRRFGFKIREAVRRALEVIEREESRVIWGIILLASVALVLGIVITFSAERTLRPLRPLRAAVEGIVRGDRVEPVPVQNPKDELGALAADFNRMALALQERDAQLEAQQSALLQREQLATVGRMSAQITHELRNPLSSIGLNSELLMEELDALDGSAEGRGLLASIIREVERLREITEEYLRFARLPRPEPVPVDLNHFAQELVEFMGSELSQAGVKARVDPDRAARTAEVDPNQLRAAVINLMRNAREALEPEGGGYLVLRVRTLGDHAALEVIDDGPGMSEEAQRRVFEPFFSTKPQGTGLGLPMVRRIAEALGARVSIDSRAGRGTTVRLELPLTTDALTSPVVHQGHRSGVGSEGSLG